MHTMEFGMDERDARALDNVLRAMEPGDLDEMRVRAGRVTVVLADGSEPRPRLRRYVTLRH